MIQLIDTFSLAYWSALCPPASSLTLCRHPTKCLQIYLSLWLCVDHLIKLVHNMQFSGLLEHDNSSCWIDIFFVQEGSLLIPSDWTIVTPSKSLQNNGAFTETSNRQDTEAGPHWIQFTSLIELLRKQTCFCSSEANTYLAIKTSQMP